MYIDFKASEKYKMLPIERSANAVVIKVPPKVPTLSPNAPRTLYRILAFKDNKNVAVICGNMKVSSGGQRIVLDVSVQSLGVGSVAVGDIIGYEQHDTGFKKPVIEHRVHQRHQHPEYLIAPEER